nr:MAG TPA: hypothetical protein [Caudoviricetes sp.]
MFYYNKHHLITNKISISSKLTWYGIIENFEIFFYFETFEFR